MVPLGGNGLKDHMIKNHKNISTKPEKAFIVSKERPSIYKQNEDLSNF